MLFIAGRQHPVEMYFTSEPQDDYQEATLTALLQLHLTQPPGHILAFLTGIICVRVRDYVLFIWLYVCLFCFLFLFVFLFVFSPLFLLLLLLFCICLYV